MWTEIAKQMIDATQADAHSKTQENLEYISTETNLKPSIFEIFLSSILYLYYTGLHVYEGWWA